MHRNDGREQPSKTVRETEAEAVAYVVCQAIGLDTNSAAADYVTLHRLRGTPAKDLTNSAAADYVTLHQSDAKTLAPRLERIQKTAAGIIAAIGPDV